MTPKKKICPTCGELKYLWNKSVGCKECCAANKPQKKPIRARSPLKRVSGKRAKELAAYSALRKSWFDAHPNCECCGSPATQVHHKNSRENERLNDTAYWMSICAPCHSEVHMNPVWARENNYLI